MSIQTNIRTFGGSVSIGTKNAGGNLLKVDGKVTTKKIQAKSISVGDLTNPHIPIGAIMIWSGSIADIPEYWKLCDGSTYDRSDNNGTIQTPDLRDIFVRGGNSTSPVILEGQHNFTLSSPNIPDHTHSHNASPVGHHSHTIGQIDMSPHTHLTNQSGTHDHGGSSNSNGDHSHGQNTNTVGHSHNANSSGSHSHRLDIVDTRSAIPPGFSVNANYNGTAGSWTWHGAIKSNNSNRESRVKDKGNHNHRYDSTLQHNHGAFQGSGAHNHLAYDMNHSHGNTDHIDLLTATRHSHVTQGGGFHDHGGFQITPSSGTTPTPDPISKLISYYVLAYVMKI